METSREIARALIQIGSVGFRVKEPITFASGILGPVYVDNRRFPFHPAEWRKVIEGFAELIKKEGLKPDVVAGVEAAGIPHSAALGFHMATPSVFIRKKPKDHGTKKRVEGGDVTGMNVLLIEDLVTTGGSSLAAVGALRDEGATVTDAMVIVTYDFPESAEAFANEKVRLHSLTSFPVILEEARAMEKISDAEVDAILAWTKDPHNWTPPA
ncbi:MAG: orotate phosphoribosyltransferase [Patescibacteria group bacterium]|nr:orotate phosphoribosyltransferase [Patescibacteria group bacterium]MDE1966085.1 orotate phosphoribosyltransferase [Patescibacteria group bacterium]